MMAKKDLIRQTLVDFANRGEFPTYAEFGAVIGVPAHGRWKAVLDAISKEETADGKPDITFLLRRKDTQLPGQIGFVPAGEPTDAQRKLAREKAQEIIEKYSPGARNPF